MKNTLFSQFFAMAFLLSFNAGAQETKTPVEIKLYTNFAWKSSLQSVGFDSILMKPIVESNYSTELGYFSPSVSFASTSGNYHEIELSRIMFNRVEEETYVEIEEGGSSQIVSGQLNTVVLIALRYEYNFMFLKNKPENRLTPALGFGIRPFYSKSNFDPKLSNDFSRGQTDVAALFSIVPRIKYAINKKWFFDLNVPFNIAQLGILTKRQDNPAIPINARTVSTFNFLTAPTDYMIRFGIGLKL